MPLRYQEVNIYIYNTEDKTSSKAKTENVTVTLAGISDRSKSTAISVGDVSQHASCSVHGSSTGSHTHYSGTIHPRRHSKRYQLLRHPETPVLSHITASRIQ